MSHQMEYSSKWWALTIPCSWDVEETRDNVKFRLPGNGSLVVSALKKQSGSVTESDVNRYARRFLDAGWTESQVEWDNFSGIRLLSSDREYAERFYVSRNALLLVIVYMHGQQDSSDEADVLSALRSIRVLRG